MQRLNRTLSFIAPMECRAVHSIPEGDDWLYELKLDGYRVQAIKNNGETHIFSRNGHLFDDRFPAVVDAVRGLRAKEIVLDGEVVALDEEGRHSFNLLQKQSGPPPDLRYYVFDLLVFDGKDIMKRPLSYRRNLLESKVPTPAASVVAHAPILEGELNSIVEQLRYFGFEGGVAKRRDSIYVPGDEPGAWQKHKIQQTADFVIGGFIPGARGLDEILVGRRDGKRLLFVESVRNGFVPATNAKVFDVIGGAVIEDCPFANLPEKKGPHRMDREKMKRSAGSSRRWWRKSPSTKSRPAGICDTPGSCGSVS